MAPLVGAAGIFRPSMIELRGVSQTVKSGGAPLTILHPLELFVPAGQSLAITGPSGSGKSTLLGLIAGLDAPTSGTIVIDGVDITRLGEDALARLRGEKIGFVFQFFHLIPVVDGVRERPGADGDWRAARCESRGPTRCWTKWACAIAAITIRRSCPAVSSSAWPSRARWRTTRRFCWPTSRRAISTAPTAATSWTCCVDVNRARETTLVLVTHDAGLAAEADAQLALRDGRRDVRALAARAAGGRLAMTFVLRMAVRETRASWRRLLFFFVCVAIGVGAIVALRSVIQSVRGVVTGEARALIAGDVVISTSRGWTDRTARCWHRG